MEFQTDQFGSFVRPPLYYENGVMYMRGRFILPFLGSSKEAAGKTKRIIAIAACVCAVLIFIVATLLSYQEPYGLPMQKEVLESIGKPLAEVAAQLEVSVEQMQQVEPGLYRIPAGGKYKGISFDVLLHFEENEGLLRNYGYEARYEADTAKAAKDIAAIAKILAIDEIILADETVLEPSKKQLKAYFTDVGAVTADLTLENTVLWSSAVTEYVEYLEGADYYEGRSGEYLIKDAIYYEDLRIAYDPETEQLAIKMWCTIETDRTKDY